MNEENSEYADYYQSLVRSLSVEEYLSYNDKYRGMWQELKDHPVSSQAIEGYTQGIVQNMSTELATIGLMLAVLHKRKPSEAVDVLVSTIFNILHPTLVGIFKEFIDPQAERETE